MGRFVYTLGLIWLLLMDRPVETTWEWVGLFAAIFLMVIGTIAETTQLKDDIRRFL